MPNPLGNWLLSFRTNQTQVINEMPSGALNAVFRFTGKEGLPTTKKKWRIQIFHLFNGELCHQGVPDPSAPANPMVNFTCEFTGELITGVLSWPKYGRNCYFLQPCGDSDWKKIILDPSAWQFSEENKTSSKFLADPQNGENHRWTALVESIGQRHPPPQQMPTGELHRGVCLPLLPNLPWIFWLKGLLFGAFPLTCWGPK